MEDINFDLAEKLGYNRPKSPFRYNDLNFFKEVIKEAEKFDSIRHFQLIVNSGYKSIYLIFQDGKIEFYENKINSKIENKIAYFYATGSKLYFVCDTEQIFVKSKIRDTSRRIEIPANFIKQENYYIKFDFPNNDLEKLDAKDRYVLDIDELDPNIIYVEGKGDLTQKYIEDSNEKKASLVRIPDNIFITNINGNNFISHILKDTNRRFINPDLLSGYIGVLFELLNKKIISSGSCFKDGTGFPSVEHTNGKSIDIPLSESTKVKIKNNKENPLNEDEIKIVKAFTNFHFTDVITDPLCKSQIANIGINVRGLQNHKDHFHFTKFDSKKVKNQTEKFEKIIARKNYS
ncbi:MAG: hypothetical protein V4497_00975 [Bacteroidota bacterium]